MSAAVLAPVDGQPFSCSTNLSNDVLDQLRRVRLSAKAWDICQFIHRRTFGDAGYHRQRREQEWWCDFDLAAWAAALPCDRSNLRRIRDELVRCRILAYEPDGVGGGRIGWNLTLDEWQHYDRRRPPVQQPSMVISEQTSMVISHHMAKITMLPTSKQLCPPDENPTQITMPASPRDLEGAGAAAALRNDPGRNNEEPEPANAGAVAAATRPARGAVASAPVASPKPSAPGALPVPASWPERRDDEPKADYYAACLRANEGNPAAALAYVAHLELRVPHTRATLTRLSGAAGRLKQKYGNGCRPWGTLLSAVMKAAAEVTDGDRLDYVDQTALRIAAARSGSGAPRAAGGRAPGGRAGTIPLLNKLRARLNAEPAIAGEATHE